MKTFEIKKRQRALHTKKESFRKRKKGRGRAIVFIKGSEFSQTSSSERRRK